LIRAVCRLAPLPAVLLAALVAMRTGVPAVAFLPNAVGLLIGCTVLWETDRFEFDFAKWSFRASLTVLTLLMSTFLFEGLDGVHRWIWLGPLSLNVSVAFTPILVWGVSNELGLSHLKGLALLAAVIAVHLTQPDAGQALVFAAGLSFSLWLSKEVSIKIRSLGAGIAILGALLTLFRHDVLAPVEHVERILPAIVNQGIPETIELLFAMVTLFAAIWLKPNPSLKRQSAIVASTYLAASILVTLIGNYPTPVFGAGLAGVLSWYMLIGLSETRLASDRKLSTVKMY